jgi:RNA polymerase sigma-70 factor, ECF subfamily
MGWMESDERLFERMRRGEQAAFDALYTRWERRLFGFIRAYLDDAAEAEDVFHETFMTVLRASADFSRGSFKAWVYQVARNACLNRLRSRRRGEAAYERHAETLPEVAAPAAVDALEAAQAERALARAVARLPRSLGEIYRLRASGLSYEEMAAVLDVPVGTVKSRMHEMVTRLKEEMRSWTAIG